MKKLRRMLSTQLVIAVLTAMLGGVSVNAADTVIMEDNFNGYSDGTYNYTTSTNTGTKLDTTLKKWKQSVVTVADNAADENEGKSVYLYSGGSLWTSDTDVFAIDGTKSAVIEFNVFRDNISAGNIVAYLVGNGQTPQAYYSSPAAWQSTGSNEMAQCMMVIPKKESGAAFSVKQFTEGRYITTRTLTSSVTQIDKIRFAVESMSGDGAYYAMDNVKVYYPESDSSVTASIFNEDSIGSTNSIILDFSNPINKTDSTISAAMFAIDGIDGAIESAELDISDTSKVVLKTAGGVFESGESYSLTVDIGIVDVFGNSYSGSVDFTISGPIAEKEDSIILEENFEDRTPGTYTFNGSTGTKLDTTDTKWHVSKLTVADNIHNASFGQSAYLYRAGALWTSNSKSLGIDSSRPFIVEYNVTADAASGRLYSDVVSDAASGVVTPQISTNGYGIYTSGSTNHVVVAVKDYDSAASTVNSYQFNNGVLKNTFSDIAIGSTIRRWRMATADIPTTDTTSYYAIDNIKIYYPGYADKMYAKSIANADTVMADKKIIVNFNNPVNASGLAASDFSITGLSDAIASVEVDNVDTHNVILTLNDGALTGSTEYTLNIAGGAFSDVLGNSMKASALTFTTPEIIVGKISVKNNGTEINEISALANGTVSATVQINNYSGDLLNGCLIIAVYKTDVNGYNKIVAVNSDISAIADGATEELSVSAEFTMEEDSTASDYVIKAFLWDGIGNDGTVLHPILPNVTIN